MFWESHDPTQGMRQGNDVGTQYRSGIYCYTDAQREAAKTSRDMYQEVLRAAGYGEITTEILRGADLLLRRGLPPAVPGEEPGRLLRPRRNRRQLPDRPRRRRLTDRDRRRVPGVVGRGCREEAPRDQRAEHRDPRGHERRP